MVRKYHVGNRVGERMSRPVTERDDVMTPDHPRWNDFIDKLSRALICERTTQNARAS